MRPVIRATPAALKRAAEMYRPVGRPATLPIGKPKPSDTKQLDLEAAKPVEGKDTNPQTR